MQEINIAEPPSNSGEWVKKTINNFIATSLLNTMEDGTDAPACEQALVGFASGADPLWQQYKEYVGAFHWTPWEVFNQHRPEENVSAEQLTVISWVLPQRKPVRDANKAEKRFPAQAWARIRVYGERCNMALRHYLVNRLEAQGHPAVAPMMAPNWTIVKSARFSYASS